MEVIAQDKKYTVISIPTSVNTLPFTLIAVNVRRVVISVVQASVLA